MHVILLGASRNIGYSVAQRLLGQGHTCTLLLRRCDAMESDPAMISYVRDGKAKLVKGGELVEVDVQRAWDTAREDGKVDAVFFGIGGEPKFSLFKGFVVTPADITARSMSILLSVIRYSSAPTTRPKLVTITSYGLDDRSHSLLPLPLKLLYDWFLRLPHKDKIEHENNVRRAAGCDQANQTKGWLGSQNLVIVRPSLLKSDKCVADTKPDMYRASVELRSAWTMSRADVAHFVVEKVFVDWERWGGNAWVVSY